jgi:hypothetical protein
MVIMGTPPNNKAWPDVPANCVFTGVVLAHDRLSVPHQVKLENMCIQQTVANERLYEGDHLWIKANVQGHYALPFHGVHLEEKADRLVLAFTLDGKRVEEALVSGLVPGTQSFAHLFNDYFILPVD